MYGELDSKHGLEAEASLAEAVGNTLKQTWLALKKTVYFLPAIVSEHRSAWVSNLMGENHFFAKPCHPAAVHW